MHADTSKPCSLSSNGFDLLSRCLEANPKRRISAVKALESDWFLSGVRRERLTGEDLLKLKAAADQEKKLEEMEAWSKKAAAREEQSAKSAFRNPFGSGFNTRGRAPLNL